MSLNNPTAADLKALRSEHIRQSETLAAQAQALGREIQRLEFVIQDLDKAIQRAETAEDSYAYEVGTRVHHWHFEDVKGVVVPTDGTGVAVKQDGVEEATYGFSAREWVVD